MKWLKVILTIIVLQFSIKLYAQTYSAQLGYQSTNSTVWNDPFFLNRGGIFFGISRNTDLNNNWGKRTGIGFSMEGFRIYAVIPVYDFTTLYYRLNYLTISECYSRKLFNKLTFEVGGGAALLIGREARELLNRVSLTYDDPNRLELRLTGGLDYEVTPKITAQLSYTRGVWAVLDPNAPLNKVIRLGTSYQLFK